MAAGPTSQIGGGFEIVRRGYDQRQVDGHLHRIDAEIRILLADREAAVDQAAQLARQLDDARARAERLRSQVQSLAHAPQTVQGMSERMRAMLRMAQDEVADMLANGADEAQRHVAEAEQQAAALVAEAREDAETLRAAARTAADEDRAAVRAEAEELRTAARAEAEELRTAARAEAEQVTAEQARLRGELEQARAAAHADLAAERAAAERQIAEAAEAAERERAQAWDESEARRTVVEEDFAIAMDRRRAAALAELEAGRVEAHRRNAELIAAASGQAQRQMVEAREKAQRIVADAEQRTADLLAQRDSVAEQIREARQRLGMALTALVPPELPSPTPAGNGAEPATAHVVLEPTAPRSLPAPRSGEVAASTSGA